MTEVTGERTFSFEGRTVVKPAPRLIPPGTHTLQIGSDASIAMAKRGDAVPYVNISFAVQGTATSEGGKNLRIFHRLFLSLAPGKDGKLSLDRESGLLAMAQAMGTLPPECTVVEREGNDAEGNAVKLTYLNPKQVVEWLQTFAGTELQARVKTEKGTTEYPDDKSVIQKFLLPAS